MVKRIYSILLCGFIILNILGCADKESFAGANRDQRIIMALEKTYPEHAFQIVKPYNKYNGNYYAVYADEKGLQFKVHTIVYDNRYHFGCYDEYLLEILKKDNFINKADEIAKKHGYVIDYDEDNQTLSLEIDVENAVDISDVTETLVEILNAVPTIPKIEYPDTTFSTGVENYYSIPEMYKLLYHFVTEKINIVGIGDISIDQKEEKAHLEQAVMEAYNRAMENKDTY